MDYRFLGRTGLRVSPLCLGTMNFGPHTDEVTSQQLMDSALESGVNFFDTANVYGGTETERIIGRWFALGGDRREKTVLATKVYGGNDQWPNSSKLSALHIRQACEASLRRMQTDHIDLYQMHHVDRDTPWDEIWQAMDLLVQQGKVLYVGSSNFAGWHVVQANEAANRRGSLGLVSEQSLYNLNARMVELEVLPACQAYGVGVIPWSPLGGGLLGGALRKVTEGRRGASASRPWWTTTATSSKRGSRCVPISVRTRLTWPWRGCSTSRPSPPRSSAPAPLSSSPGRTGHSRSRSSRTRSMPSTRSFPVPVGPRPRPTPGRSEPRPATRPLRHPRRPRLAEEGGQLVAQPNAESRCGPRPAPRRLRSGRRSGRR